MEILRNKGKVEWSTNEWFKGKSKANDFLRSLIMEVISKASKYIVNTGENPFGYRELQLHSFFAPAIEKITTAFLMEHPMTRAINLNDKDETYQGRLDYWCRCPKGYDYFIEIKKGHQPVNNREGRICKRNSKLWQQAADQITELENEALRFSEHSQGVIMVSILVISNRQSSNEKTDTDKLRTTHKNYYKNINNDHKPNFGALWILHDNLVESSSRYSKYKYPAVSFLAKIHELR